MKKFLSIFLILVAALNCPAPGWFGGSGGTSGVITNLSGEDGITVTPGNPIVIGQDGTLATVSTINSLSNRVEATALTNYSVTLTNLNNDQWRAVQASRLADFNHFRKDGWTNTLAKISRGENIRILEQGNGLVDAAYGLLTEVTWQATNKFNLAGCFTVYDPIWKFESSAGSQEFYTGKNTNWHGPNGIITNQAAWYYQYHSPTSFKWNVLSVDYIGTPTGGLMAVLTNGVFATSINFSNNTRIGKTFYWTNSIPFSSNVRFTNTSGTNVFLLTAVGVLNTTVSNGIIVGRDAMPDSGWTNIMAVDSVVRTPIFKSWAADMAILQSIEGTNESNTTQMTNLLTWHRTNTPATDIVLCGTYPVPSTSSDILGQNSIMRNWAQIFGVSYFDGWNVFGSGYSAITNVSIPRGFSTIAADVHYTVEGMDTYGYFLSRWLGLDKVKFIGGSGSVSLSNSTNRAGIVSGSTVGTNLNEYARLSGANTFTAAQIVTNGSLTVYDNISSIGGTFPGFNYKSRSSAFQVSIYGNPNDYFKVTWSDVSYKTIMGITNIGATGVLGWYADPTLGSIVLGHVSPFWLKTNSGTLVVNGDLIVTGTISPPQNSGKSARLTNDFNLVSIITLSNSLLTLTLPTGNWLLRCQLSVTSTVTAGAKVAIATSPEVISSGFISSLNNDVLSTTYTMGTPVTNARLFVVSTPVTQAGVQFPTYNYDCFITTTNTTTLTAQFCQHAMDSAGSALKAGSWMVATKID
jgi:hypothetical protein